MREKGEEKCWLKGGGGVNDRIWDRDIGVPEEEGANGAGTIC